MNSDICVSGDCLNMADFLSLEQTRRLFPRTSSPTPSGNDHFSNNTIPYDL